MGSWVLRVLGFAMRFIWMWLVFLFWIGVADFGFGWDLGLSDGWLFGLGCCDLVLGGWMRRLMLLKFGRFVGLNLVFAGSGFRNAFRLDAFGVFA